MIIEAIFEVAYQAALKNKQIIRQGMSNTDKGIELYGRSNAFSDFIMKHGLDGQCKACVMRRGRKKANE